MKINEVHFFFFVKKVPFFFFKLNVLKIYDKKKMKIKKSEKNKFSLSLVQLLSC